MTRNPNITQEQKEKFLIELTFLMKEAPEELQKLWDGKLSWNYDEPYMNNDIQFKLTEKLKVKFNTLLIKLSQGRVSE